MTEVRYEIEAKPMGEIILKLDVTEGEYKRFRLMSKEEKIRYIVKNGVKKDTINLEDIEYVLEKRVEK